MLAQYECTKPLQKPGWRFLETLRQNCHVFTLENIAGWLWVSTPQRDYASMMMSVRFTTQQQDQPEGPSTGEWGKVVHIHHGILCSLQNEIVPYLGKMNASKKHSAQ